MSVSNLYNDIRHIVLHSSLFHYKLKSTIFEKILVDNNSEEIVLPSLRTGM